MTTSGSTEFDRLRAHLIANANVKREVEFAFSSLLTAANPSDRGLRFLFGSGAEWIMAATAWAAGILTAPAGHNADGFDLGDLLNNAKGLWSVKASASASAGDIRLKNFMGDGSGAAWTEPTLFVGPYLNGAVLVDPSLHVDVSEKVRRGSDALLLGGGVVKKFASQNPANYVSFDVAINNGGSANDPYAFVKSVITPEHFPILSKPLVASEPAVASNLVDDIRKLAELRDQGVLDEEAFSKALGVLVN